MPTYIKNPDKPQWMDPEQDSVMDPLYQTLLKKAARGVVKVAGWDDPTTAVTSAASPLVAAVKPTHIPALREQGRRMLERVKTEGLGKDKTPVPVEYMRGLEAAQKKWPRIFGHITDIREVDKDLVKATNNSVMGYQRNNFVDPRFSTLHLNPTATSKPTPFIIGHELHHVAENLLDPKRFDAAYTHSMSLPDSTGMAEFLNIPSGYPGSAFEARANIQGRRLQNMVNNVPNPKPRSLNSIEDELLKRLDPNPAARNRFGSR